MNILLLVAQLVPILILIYFYINRKYSYWSKRGVKGPTPSLLQLGNLFQIAGSANQSISEVDLVKKYGTIYGTYTGLQPVLTVNDAEWVKRIMVKDFHLFINRSPIRAYSKYNNPNLSFLEGDDWKRVRTLTSPSFTIGKLRAMHSMMDRCIQKLDQYLRKVATTGTGVIKAREVITGFTLDVIASTSFALDIDSNGDRTKPNRFVQHATSMLEIGQFQALAYLTMPKWFNRLVGVEHMLNRPYLQYVVDLSAELLKQRKNSPIKRDDFMQLLMDASVNDSELKSMDYAKLSASSSLSSDVNESGESKKENITAVENQKKTTLTDTEIIAQSVFFMSAGFETTATTLTNLIFELSQNPDVQERLYEVLIENLDGVEPNSAAYYDTVMQRIPYLDAVIKETLRKYPPVNRLERRVAIDDYKVAGIALQKDQLVEISTMAVHHNPDYYPEPDQFKPDRFLPENKHRLVPYTYLPFGEGPRNCLGLRFAYQKMKLFASHIVRQFRFCPTAQTPSKLEFEGFKFLMFVKPFETRVELR